MALTSAGNLRVNGGVTARDFNKIEEQGAHLQWNRSGAQGETWLINTTVGSDPGIRFGKSTLADSVTELMRIQNNGDIRVVGGGTFGNSLLVSTGNLHVISQNDQFGINPDAANNLLIYDDLQGTTLRSGITTGNLSYVQNSYVQLIPSAPNSNGSWYHIMNPGNAFTVVFDQWHEQGGTNVETLNFFWGGTTTSNGYVFQCEAYFGITYFRLYFNGTQLGTTFDLGRSFPQSYQSTKITFQRNTIRVVFGSTLVINFNDTPRNTSSAILGTAPLVGFAGTSGGSYGYIRIRNIKLTKLSEGLWDYTSLTSPNISFNGGSVAVESGNLLIQNRISSLGYQYAASSLNGNSVTTNVNVINKRIKSSRATAVSAVSTWTLRTSNLACQGIAWSPELGIFAATNYNGSIATTSAIQTSPDGINWTTRTTPSIAVLSHITWSPELNLFAATSYQLGTSSVITSPDGITWSSRTTPAFSGSSGWADICWSAELGLFVSVLGSTTANSSWIMTSSNGTTWTGQTTPSSSSWPSICWAAELNLFVVCAANGSVNSIATSPNGTTWTLQTTPNTNGYYSVKWSAELGLLVAISNTNTCITSPDGITWTARTTVSGTWQQLVWCQELSIFVACQTTVGTSAIMTSHDGINWVARTTPSTQLWGLCYSPELSIFVGVNALNTNLITSNFGIPTSKNSINNTIIYGGSTDTGTGASTKYTQNATNFTTTTFTDLVSMTLDIGTYSISGICQLQLTSGTSQLAYYKWVIGGQSVGQGYVIYTGHDTAVHSGYNTTNMDTIYVNITINSTVVKIQGRWQSGVTSITDQYQRISCVRLD